MLQAARIATGFALCALAAILFVYNLWHGTLNVIGPLFVFGLGACVIMFPVIRAANAFERRQRRALVARDDGARHLAPWMFATKWGGYLVAGAWVYVAVAHDWVRSPWLVLAGAIAAFAPNAILETIFRSRMRAAARQP